MCIFVANSLPVSASPTEWRVAFAPGYSAIPGARHFQPAKFPANDRSERVTIGRFIAQRRVRVRPVSARGKGNAFRQTSADTRFERGLLTT
jgi:hypothetical protein